MFVGPNNGLLSLALADRTGLHVYALTSPVLMARGTETKPASESRDVDDIYAYAAGSLAASAVTFSPPRSSQERGEVRSSGEIGHALPCNRPDSV